MSLWGKDLREWTPEERARGARLVGAAVVFVAWIVVKESLADPRRTSAQVFLGVLMGLAVFLATAERGKLSRPARFVITLVALVSLLAYWLGY